MTAGRADRVFEFIVDPLADQPIADQLRRARIRLERSVRAGHARAAESCFLLEPALLAHRDSALDLIYSEFVLREQLGQHPEPADWLARFPDLRDDLEEVFRLHGELAATEARLPQLSALGQAATVANAGPYELLEEIGRGGMGVVYRARDRRLGRIVAVKFLQGERAGQPEALERFRREARAASALNSPHICTIYEMDEQAGQPFIAMEWVAGRTLREEAQADLSMATITRLVSQVAQALGVAHTAGIVHRDIKPGNIAVRPDGCAKVLDFGMARLLTSEGAAPALPLDATTPGTLVGTVAYMSPEQARCEPVGPASDVFSLGVILYELSTGRHPFERDSPVATLAAVMSDDPLPASHLNPELPAALDELIGRMLAKHPADRPTAADVERSLATIASADVLSAPDGRALRDGPAVDTTSGSGRRTVGREHEVDRLRDALAAATGGDGLFRCVAGEPGIGKTTLVDRFLASLSGPPAARPAIGRGRCSERLAGSEAYLPVIEAVEGLLRADPTGGTARTLRQLAPTWHAQLTAVDLSAPTDHAVASVTQERLKREFLNFLREIARGRPCVLFLDDVHWADLSTVDLLAYLGAHCTGLRLLIILTYRPSDLVLAKHPLLPVRQELQARGVCEEIALPFLSDVEIGRYLDAEFRGHAFPADFAGFLLGQTSGNPLFLVDLLRYLSETNVVARDASGVWTLTKPPTEFQRELPQSVRSMVQRKIDQLLEDDRKLLTMASVQGHEFDAAVVARALGQDAAEVEDRLATLYRLHAVVKQVKEVELPDQTLTTRFAFVHVLYGNALFASLQPARKSAAAAAVAAAMQVAHAGHLEPVAVQMAVLLETARDFARAANYFLLAAENARRLFAQREAAALARRGLGLIARLPDDPSRVTLELRLTMALGIALQSAAGHGNAEVKQIFGRTRELCALVDDARLRFQTLTGLFWYESARGNFVGACRDLSVELLAIAAARPEPEYALQAHQAHGLHLLQIGRPAEADTHFRDGFQQFDRARHARLSHVFGQNPAVMCLGFSGMNVALMGRTDEGVVRADDSVRLAEEIADVPSLIFAYFFRLFVAGVRRDPGPALSDGPGYIEQARDTPFFHSTLRAYVGYAEAQSGQTDRGLHELHTAVAAFRAAGGLALIPTFCALLGDLLLSIGRNAEAAVQIEDGLTVARDCGNPWFDPELLRLRAVVALKNSAAPGVIANAFAIALACARRQQAATFELRTLIDAVRGGVIIPGRDLHDELAALHGRLKDVNHTPDMDAAGETVR